MYSTAPLPSDWGVISTLLASSIAPEEDLKPAEKEDDSRKEAGKEATEADKGTKKTVIDPATEGVKKKTDPDKSGNPVRPQRFKGGSASEGYGSKTTAPEGGDGR